MNNNALKYLALVTSSLSLLACGGANGQGQSDTSAGKSDTAQVSETESALEKERSRDGALGDMVIGNPDSDITLIEYASFTCGHCANFHLNVFPAIKEKYITSNKIKFIFRELPTGPQELSYIGSVLARCASDRGGDEAFFAVGDGLFRNQQLWAFGNEPKLELLKITTQAGMDEEAVDTCLKRQEIVDVINKNVKEANDVYKVTGTPTFILNGKKIKTSALEEELANALGEE